MSSNNKFGTIIQIGDILVSEDVVTWGICKDAYEKGRREGIRVYQFLRDPIISVFGQDFYDALSYAAKNILASR